MIESPSKSGYIFRFREVYSGILALKGKYEPSAIVDGVFSELVALAIDPSSIHDFNESQIRQLQAASNAAEVELERYWARRIIASNDPQAEVEQFPYIGNYRELTEMELKALHDSGIPNHFNRATFVGGGLPLTAYVLAKDYGLRSVVLDSDHEMAVLAREVVSKLGMDRIMEVIECPGEAFSDYGRLAVVAALAGVKDRIKERIFSQIPDQTTVIARTVESGTPRELLYKPLLESILATRKVVDLVHPRQTLKYQAVINSAAILEGTSNAD